MNITYNIDQPLDYYNTYAFSPGLGSITGWIMTDGAIGPLNPYNDIVTYDITVRVNSVTSEFNTVNSPGITLGSGCLSATPTAITFDFGSPGCVLGITQGAGTGYIVDWQPGLVVAQLGYGNVAQAFGANPIASVPGPIMGEGLMWLIGGLLVYSYNRRRIRKANGKPTLRRGTCGDDSPSAQCK